MMTDGEDSECQVCVDPRETGCSTLHGMGRAYTINSLCLIVEVRVRENYDFRKSMVSSTDDDGETGNCILSGRARTHSQKFTNDRPSSERILSDYRILRLFREMEIDWVFFYQGGI